MLSAISNDTEMELGNNTAASHPEALKTSTSVTLHLANDFGPEGLFYSMGISLGADKIQNAIQSLYGFPQSR